MALLLALHVSIQQSPPHQFRDKSRDRNGQQGRDVLETGAVVVSPWEFAVIRYLHFQCSKNDGAADGLIVYVCGPMQNAKFVAHTYNPGVGV